MLALLTVRLLAVLRLTVSLLLALLSLATGAEATEARIALPLLLRH